MKPVLKWVPGLGVKEFITKYRKVSQDVVDVPFNIVKVTKFNTTRMGFCLTAKQNREESDHSFVSISLERMRKSKDILLPDEEAVISNTAGIAYAAAAGTVCDHCLKKKKRKKKLKFLPRLYPSF